MQPLAEGAFVGVELVEQSEHYIWTNGPTRRLGGGAFGEVLTGHAKETGQMVAVKRFGPEERNFVQQKRELLFSLRSNYVVEHIALENVQYITILIMELADGTASGELRMLEHYFGLPYQMLLTLIDHLAEALQYLNRKMILHGDIKPDNLLIFCGPKLAFKLGDFSSARQLRDQNELMYNFDGSEAYANPEILRQQHLGRNERGGYTKDDRDLWSSACCMFQCATGRLIHSDQGILYTYEIRSTRQRAERFDQMPMQHCSCPRQLQGILYQFFRLLFNHENGHLQFQRFYDLCKELTSLKRYKYYNISALREDEYFDVTAPTIFRRATFHEDVVNGLEDRPEMNTNGPSRRIKIIRNFETCRDAVHFQPTALDGQCRIIAWQWVDGHPENVDVSESRTIVLPPSPLGLEAVQLTGEARDAVEKAIALVLRVYAEELRLRQFFTNFHAFLQDFRDAVLPQCGEGSAAAHEILTLMRTTSAIPSDIEQEWTPNMHHLRIALKETRIFEAVTQIFSLNCHSVEREYENALRSLETARNYVSSIIRQLLGQELSLLYDNSRQLQQRNPGMM